MSREEAQALYAGKTFFIKQPDGTLDGPREDIYYAVNRSGFLQKLKYLLKIERPYKFLQVIDGTPKRAFYDDEIVVKQDGK
jgi:hypothetical protein